MPGIKPTREQRDEAVEYTRELLIRALHFGQIKQALRMKFPWITGKSTCSDYVGRARQVMLSDMSTDREEQRAESLSRYHAVLRDKDSSPMEKIKAQERIDKLLGLEMPHRTELTGANGKPLAVEHSAKPDYDIAAMERITRGLIGLPEDNGHTESVHPAHSNGKAGGGPGQNGN